MWGSHCPHQLLVIITGKCIDRDRDERNSFVRVNFITSFSLHPFQGKQPCQPHTENRCQCSSSTKSLVTSTPRLTHNSHWTLTRNSKLQAAPPRPKPESVVARTLGPKLTTMAQLFSEAFGEDNQTANAVQTSPVIRPHWLVCRYESEHWANQRNICSKFLANHVRFWTARPCCKLHTIVNATIKLCPMPYIIGMQHVPGANGKDEDARRSTRRNNN